MNASEAQEASGSREGAGPKPVQKNVEKAPKQGLYRFRGSSAHRLRTPVTA
jgi:hypothetical protein